jgi:hypothetical protein
LVVEAIAASAERSRLTRARGGGAREAAVVVEHGGACAEFRMARRGATGAATSTEARHWPIPRHSGRPIFTADGVMVIRASGARSATATAQLAATASHDTLGEHGRAGRATTASKTPAQIGFRVRRGDAVVHRCSRIDRVFMGGRARPGPSCPRWGGVANSSGVPSVGAGRAGPSFSWGTGVSR